MNRRELITRLASGFTALSISPAFADIVTNYAPKPGQPEAAPGVLNKAQLSQLTVLVDCVIPATDTPGANAAGVPAFINYLLEYGYPEQERAQFKSGLVALEKVSVLRFGKTFSACSDRQQIQLLTDLEAESLQQEEASAAGDFVIWMKELTVLGYYTSEIGATGELNYLPIPGPYQGCIDFSEVGRTWAL
jgi:gluconate 2-dehydrogenase gamma chain